MGTDIHNFYIYNKKFKTTVNCPYLPTINYILDA